MTISVESVAASVRERGLVPVKLHDDPSTETTDRFWRFDGTLDEFLEVAKSLGSKAIYVSPYTFESGALVCSAEEQESDGEYGDDDTYADDEDRVLDADSGSIDLMAVEPRLSAFGARVGEAYCITLLAVTGEVDLQLDLFASWHDDFSALRELTVERLRASADERALAREAAEERRLEAERADLLEKLERLPTDPAFRDLRTKAAMTAYVSKEFPEAKDVLSNAEYREKLTELHNRAHLERSLR